MHKLTMSEKAKIGGKLARMFGLKLDPVTKGYNLPNGLTNRSAAEVFEIAHEVIVKSDYCEAVKKAVKALKHVSRDCQMALGGTWDRGDDGFEATRDSVDDALRGLGVEPPVETPEEDGNE